MQVRAIPPENVVAATTLLKPEWPHLSTQGLVAALNASERSGAATRRGAMRMLRKREAAELLAVSLSTIDRMLRAGTLPKRTIGGSVRVPADAIHRLMEGTSHE